MANVEFGDLPAGTVAGADIIPIEQGGVTKRTTAQAVADLVSGETVQDLAGAMWTGNTELGGSVTYQDGDGTLDFVATCELLIALSDETTAITTGTAKVTIRMPYAMTVTEVRSSLTTVSSSGLVTVDINESGSTILSTKLSIDQGEKTSTTAATPAVISDSALADDAEITFDIDAAGTGATGLKVWLIGTRA